MTEPSAWLEAFLDAGPGYPAQTVSMSEMQALLLRAARGAEIPFGHAQDLSMLAPLLLSDPKLLAMAIAALAGPHATPQIDGTRDHRVIEAGSVIMAGPVVVDFLVAGTGRVVVHDLRWPLVLWPFLAQAERVYGLCLDLSVPGPGTQIVSQVQTSTLESFGPPQPAPLELLNRLAALAARTYVPDSATSRLKGAGAGTRETD